MTLLRSTPHQRLGGIPCRRSGHFDLMLVLIAEGLL